MLTKAAACISSCALRVRAGSLWGQQTSNNFKCRRHFNHGMGRVWDRSANTRRPSTRRGHPRSMWPNCKPIESKAFKWTSMAWTRRRKDQRGEIRAPLSSGFLLHKLRQKSPQANGVNYRLNTLQAKRTRRRSWWSTMGGNSTFKVIGWLAVRKWIWTSRVSRLHNWPLMAISINLRTLGSLR